jgi:hypothetical protein
MFDINIPSQGTIFKVPEFKYHIVCKSKIQRLLLHIGNKSVLVKGSIVRRMIYYFCRDKYVTAIFYHKFS